MTSDWQSSAGEALGSPIVHLAPLGGGDTAASFRATLDDGRTVFVKTHRDPPPGFFTTEAMSLQWLQQTQTVDVPRVLAAADRPPYLALAWIESRRGGATPSEDATFGDQLARLHACHGESFGRSDARTTGSLRLPNRASAHWASFYGACRLQPLHRIAEQRRSLPTQSLNRLQHVIDRLPTLIGALEPPSLLHGDLWAGNRVIDPHGASWVIDPASFFGHREFDLAMMRLFGGFGASCFEAYQDRYPLSEGWESRVSLYQLAPLTVHAIKFGGGYVSGVDQALRACSSIGR